MFPKKPLWIWFVGSVVLLKYVGNIISIQIYMKKRLNKNMKKVDKKRKRSSSLLSQKYPI